MTFNPLEYEGNAIFRNQPNHSYFDKSFENDLDPLFLHFNEIDQYYQQPEQRAKSLDVFSVSVIDPRTQKSVTQLEYDHTKEEDCKIFESPKRSILTVQQHKMCVQALNCLQHGKPVEEEQLYNWYSTHNARLREKELFQKFVAELCQSNNQLMNMPCRKLLDLYQKWYKTRSRKLITKYSQETYNTHLGLPHVRFCKNVLKEMQIQICDPEIVANLGDCSKWREDSSNEIMKLEQRLSSYFQIFVTSEDKRDELEKELHNLFIKEIEEETYEYPLFYIPLESLLFLLTAGDYLDLPMEMFLNINDVAANNENQKVVIMDIPLPSRQGGWHSYQHVVEETVAAVLSINQRKVNIKSNEGIESQAPKTLSNMYKVFPFDEYMQNCKASKDQLCQFSKTLIKWKLMPLEEENHFNIYTSLSSTPTKEDDPDDLFSLKLEFKPHLGCEIKTSYQLLKEWLQLKLLRKNNTTCFRLDVTNFKTLLQENLTDRKLEEYLSDFYHINCQQLIMNLYEFLKMLHNMPCDHYMLRFNPKFKDKLLLCKPSKEITQNTLFLHQLLDTDISDILFMSQGHFLHIDDSLCSKMHLQHNIIPCAFSPLARIPNGSQQNKSFKICEKKKAVHTLGTQQKPKKKECGNRNKKT